MISEHPPNDGMPGNVLQFPAAPIVAARDCADDPTSQLIESLFSVYRASITAYWCAPSTARWRELRRSFLCWHTAFVAECEGGGKT